MLLPELNAEIVRFSTISQGQCQVSSKVVFFDQFRCFFIDVVIQVAILIGLAIRIFVCTVDSIVANDTQKLFIILEGEACIRFRNRAKQLTV